MKPQDTKDRSVRNMERIFSEYRPLLFSIAYRMLGTVGDAEDIVQEAFLGVQSVRLEEISNVKSYLCKMVVNRCLNEMKSARRRREQYIGEWLPEPLLDEQDLPAEAAERKEELSYAFLVMLDRLSPLERAVFLLRTAYEYDYADIGGMIGKNETYARKLYSNARKKVGEDGPSRHESVPFDRRQLLERFVHAFQRRDIDGLMGLLNEDAVLVSDGGGRIRAALKPIYTRGRVITLLKVMAERRLDGARADIRKVSGREELAFYKDGRLIAVLCFAEDEEEARFRTVYVVFNPDKLQKAPPGRF